jgi:hypothetical protein
LINKSLSQLNAERAARRASYPKGINWFKKKFDRDLSHKPQAASASKRTQLKSRIKT